MKKTLQTVKITSEQENPPEIELIAEEIIKISDACAKMQSSRLNKRAICLLIKDRLSGVGLGVIEDVLDTASKLKDYYIKK